MHRPPGFLGIVKRAKDWTLPTRCTLPESASHHPKVIDDSEAFEILDHEPTTHFARTRSAPHLINISSKCSKKVKMGGKSNKFDYTNRSSTGFKLGQIIGHALEKEAAKLQRAADKEADKIRKRSYGSSTTTSDDTGHIHVVDLQAPDKDLGDDGLCALADGLEVALESGTLLAIEDLNLSGNALTTASLLRLAPIIRLARHDLKTLNLSNNNIKVETNDQAVQWEAFMQSFGECFRLRRLDLRDNNDLGSRAMEIFARVHTRETKIDPITPDWCDSVLSIHSDHESEVVKEEMSELEQDDYDDSRLAGGQLLKNRRGLRSIPYIELNNIGLTEAGALWLSYVMQDHHYPTQLIDGLNATTAASSVSAYQQDSGMAGVSWDESAVAKDARGLLKKTEIVRYRIMLEQHSVSADSLFEEGAYGEGLESGSRDKQSLERRLSSVVVRDRTGSVRSIHTNDGGEHEMTEVESLRRRIQRHIIDHDGVQSVDLWYAALTLVTFSRYLGWLVASRKESTPIIASLSLQRETATSTPTGRLVSEKFVQRHGDDTRAAAPDMKVEESYAKLLVAPTNRMLWKPQVVLSDVTNTLTTPKMVFKPHRRSPFSEIADSDLSLVTERLQGAIVRHRSPERFVRYQRERISAVAATSAVRSELECAFSISDGCRVPQNILDLILTFAVPPQRLTALSSKQKMAVWQWGQNRATLATEMEWRKHDRSSQVWMLLEKVGCLAYEEI